jgi:predicted Rossmann fold nucleotide-binding protein DprA/Smf involved in DNA uptake
MKVIIAGGRYFEDYALLCRVCDYMLSNTPNDEIIIVSGTAYGADKLGEKYANERGYPINQFPADWDTYGKSAGYRRNEQMAENADALIAFWDRKSKGTKSMIDIAIRKSLKLKVEYYESN